MNGRRIFWRLFLSYLALLLISICIIALIYQTSITSMQEAVYRQSRNTLESIRDTTDTLLKSIDNYVATIMYDEDITSFLSLQSFEPNNAAISKIYQYTRTLGKYNLADSMIKHIYILSDANDFVLFTNNAVRYNELYHDSILGFMGMDYAATKAFFKTPSFRNGYYIFPGNQGESASELVYIIKVPTTATPKITPGGTILVRVNTQTIMTLLQQACVGDKSAAFILDNEDHLLAFCAGDGMNMSADSLLDDYRSLGMSALYNGRYNITQVVSDLGWQYISVIPLETALSDVYSARLRIIAITLLLVIVGIVISYILTRKKARSLGKTVTALSSEVGMGEGKRNEYVFIADAVARLVSDRSSFKSLSENQLKLIDCELVRRLLLEDYRHLDELKGLISASGKVWDGWKYAVISVNIQGRSENGGTYSDIPGLFYDCLSRHWRPPFYMLAIDESCIVLLILSDPAFTKSEWHERSRAVCEAMDLNIQGFTGIYYCVSEQYERLADIHQAYDETVVIKEYAKALRQSRSILRLNDLPHSDEFYYYPMDVEIKLVQHVKTGNVTELDKLLNMIYVENFEKRVLSMAMIRQLMFELRGTIVRCLGSVVFSDKMNEMMQELNRETTIDGIFRYVVKISMEICEIVKVKNNADAVKLKKVILDTIENNYSDSNFSIHQLSESLHINENALYCFIREHFEQTFWEMVENVRIHKACELMRDKSMPIRSVASRVGFNNDHSFRRTFKRIMNVAPSEYISST